VQDAKVHRTTHIEYHSKRPEIIGWSEPRSGIFQDPLTPEERSAKPFHPFGSEEEWELFESIAQMGLTDGSVNHLLNTQYVSYSPDVLDQSLNPNHSSRSNKSLFQ
jgi:hypothetical protein